MSRSTMNRVAAVAASGALVAAGAVVGLGVGTATADTATCKQSSQATKGPNLETWGVKHIYERSVDVATAATGTSVTYTTQISTTGIGNPYVNTITEFAPTGFGAPTYAEVGSYHLLSSTVSFEEVHPTANAGGWKVTSPGWFVNSSNPVILKTTYTVPKNTPVGTEVTSGGIGVAGTVGVANELPNLSACFTVRMPNVGEAGLGSLDAAGLGSEDGQLSSTGSVSDILGDTILNVIQGLQGS